MRLDEDTLLMLKAGKDDALAYSRLYKKYLPIVVDYLASLDGAPDILEDLAQIVFVRMWQNRRLFRAESSVKTYIFAVARNVLREQLRESHRELAICRNSRQKDCPVHEGSLRLQELAEAVERAKAKLSDKQREALELALCSDMSLADAAKRARCSDCAFRQRLHEARSRLLGLLGWRG